MAAIKKEFIGSQAYSKLTNSTVTITDDPAKYKWYRQLGLEYIFENDKDNKKPGK